MKILHIIPNLLKGGAERLVTDIVRELKKRPDIKVRLVLLRNEIEYDIEDIKDVVKIIPAYVQLSLWKKNKLNIEALQGFIEEFQPDIIHSHLFEAEIVSRSCLYPKAKWFSHGHGNMPQLVGFNLLQDFNKKRIIQFYEKQYLFKSYTKNGGTHFIAISNNTKDYYDNIKKKNKLTLIYNAIEYKKFYIDKNSLLNNKEKAELVLINVGTLNDRKNQSFLLKVIIELNKLNVKCKLILVGDGPNNAKLKEDVKNHHLENVVFTGKINNVEDYLKKADVYLHSSIYEPFGLVLLEAMSAGLPVISTNGKGNTDILINGVNGYIIDEFKELDFAKKIIELINDKEKLRNISLNAQKFALKFDIVEYTDKLIEIYKK